MHNFKGNKYPKGINQFPGITAIEYYMLSEHGRCIALSKCC